MGVGVRHGGRQKGTPNKKTQAFQEILDQYGINPVERLSDIIDMLEPSDQASVCLKLLEYVYPKRKAVEVSEAPKPIDPEEFEHVSSDQLLKIVKNTEGA